MVLCDRRLFAAIQFIDSILPEKFKFVSELAKSMSKKRIIPHSSVKCLLFTAANRKFIFGMVKSAPNKSHHQEKKMGLFDFAADIGKKLFGDDDEDAGDKIRQHIEEDNPGVEGLKVEVDEGVAKVSGKAKDQSAFEKAILMAGNIFGVNKVEAAELEAPEAEVEVEYYEIQSGDTLWGIASKILGNGSKYPEIFEANREVIKDPDLIYPGQKIRIPLG